MNQFSSSLNTFSMLYKFLLLLLFSHTLFWFRYLHLNHSKFSTYLLHTTQFYRNRERFWSVSSFACIIFYYYYSWNSIEIFAAFVGHHFDDTYNLLNFFGQLEWYFAPIICYFIVRFSHLNKNIVHSVYDLYIFHFFHAIAFSWTIYYCECAEKEKKNQTETL